MEYGVGKLWNETLTIDDDILYAMISLKEVHI